MHYFNSTNRFRGIYEQTIIFRNLFVYPETDVEKMILLNLWKIKGLLNRQDLKKMPEKYSEMVKREAEEISNLKREIYSLPEHVINRAGIKAIENFLKRYKGKDTLFTGYKFKKKGSVINGGEAISFTKAPKEFLHSDDLDVVLYRLLSLHSHSSYLSVLQFQEVRQLNEYWDYAILILRGLCYMMDIFISDFCVYEKLEVNVVSNKIQVYKK